MALLVAAPPLLVSVLTSMPDSGWRGMLLFGGALAVSIALAMYFGTKISQPVQSLIDDAHALAIGVAGHRSRIQSSDEIGSLATALNQMAVTIEHRNAALADSERRYRFLFDSNPLPMWAWDADTMLVLAINEAAIEKYGYDRDTFLSLRILDLLDPAEHARFSSARLPFSESKQSAGTWRHRTARGRQLEMDVITTSSRRLGRASWL
jgi:PAS domain S-box-containing protein